MILIAFNNGIACGIFRNMVLHDEKNIYIVLLLDHFIVTLHHIMWYNACKCNFRNVTIILNASSMLKLKYAEVNYTHYTNLIRSNIK